MFPKTKSKRSGYKVLTSVEERNDEIYSPLLQKQPISGRGLREVINTDNDGGAAGPSRLKAKALQDFAEVQKDRKGKAKKRKNKVRKALESCAIGRAVINFWVPDLQTLHEYNYRGKGPDLWLSTKPPMLSAGVFIVAL